MESRQHGRIGGFGGLVAGDFLDRRACVHRKDAQLARKLYLASRAERGLISYDKRKTDELLSFCAARHIDVTKIQNGGEGYKNRLIDLLEAADEEATLERFIDLIPELRVLIYTAYFESFEVNNEAVLSIPPPITEVSKLVRNETLLLFYQTRRFYIKLNRLFQGPLPPSDSFTPMPASRVALRFFEKAPLQYVQSIRRVRLYHPSVQTTKYGGRAIFECDIDLHTRRTEAKVISARRLGNFTMFGGFQDALEEHIRKKTCVPEGNPELGREGVTALQGWFRMPEDKLSTTMYAE